MGTATGARGPLAFCTQGESGVRNAFEIRSPERTQVTVRAGHASCGHRQRADPLSTPSLTRVAPPP